MTIEQQGEASLTEHFPRQVVFREISYGIQQGEGGKRFIKVSKEAVPEMQWGSGETVQIPLEEVEQEIEDPRNPGKVVKVCFKMILPNSQVVYFDAQGKPYEGSVGTAGSTGNVTKILSGREA